MLTAEQISKIKEAALDKMPYKIGSLALRVAPIYEFLEWEWEIKEGKRVERYIPEYGDITTTLWRLYHLLGGEFDCISCSSGGLFCRIENDDIDMYRIEVGFEMTETTDYL